jgi:DNA sulfur modification protein DndD
MCYYGTKPFEFADGLNIILGHNGDGKSTIFTAFNWIFNSEFSLILSDVYSQKKYSEILENESFDVKVECVVVQYNSEYKISKSFTVTKNANYANTSRIKEEILKRDLQSGELLTDNRSISDLSRQVFPAAFRNFSMFETETDALKIIEGKQLAELVKSFSDAKHYDKLDEVIAELATRADKQFRKESKADTTAQETIDAIDRKIKNVSDDIDKLTKRIAEDEKGRDFYTDKINELVNNLTISEDFKKIDDEISQLKEKTDKARNELKYQNRFTDFLFDSFYILKGFDNIMSDFSRKIDDLRQKKNEVNDEELRKFAVEKLKLENGATPFPPGFPSLEILKEILKDDICKICNTPLNENAKDYINKSIKLYEKSKNKQKELKDPVIFTNNFIDEFQIINHTHTVHSEKYSKERITEEIEFCIKRITDYNNLIDSNKKQIEDKKAEKENLLSKVPDILKNELKNLRKIHSDYTIEKDELISKIGENNVRLERKKQDLQDLNTTRTKTLAQFKGSNFKLQTVELLNSFSEIAKVVKGDEYEKFLKVLSDRATAYLKQINVGEITGKIELYKKNEEVKYKSLNDDGSLRTQFDNSGAMQISIPLSILFAIADIAAETVDKEESYPMIFDAPTGRFSPDREQKFFKILKETKKQRIVVTLKFLGVENQIPFVKKDDFQHIEKDKAFFIKRVRPFENTKHETINTEIEVLN